MRTDFTHPHPETPRQEHSIRWTPFFFEGNRCFKLIETPTAFNQIREGYPELTDEEILDCQETTYKGTRSQQERDNYPRYGCRIECDGERTLRHFFRDHGMQVPPPAEDWNLKMFGSGTMIVEDDNQERIPMPFGGTRGSKPHYYVYGPTCADEAERNTARYNTCKELQNWLNGGARPVWFDLLQISDPCGLKADNGIQVLATGPSIDRAPPKGCDWVEDPSPAAEQARVALIERIILAPGTPGP